MEICTRVMSASRVRLQTELRFEWVHPQMRPLLYLDFYRLGGRYGTEGEYVEWVRGNRERARKWGWKF